MTRRRLVAVSLVLAALTTSACSVHASVHVGSSLSRDQRRVRAASMKVADLSPEWAQCCPDSFWTARALHERGDCAPTKAAKEQTAGFDRAFQLDHQPDGAWRARMEITVRAARTTAAAQQIYTAIQSAAYNRCIVTASRSNQHDFNDKDAVMQPTDVTSVERHLPITGFTRLSTTRYRSYDDKDLVYYEDWITLLAGRLRTTIIFAGVTEAQTGFDAWARTVDDWGEPAIIAKAAEKLTNSAE